MLPCCSSEITILRKQNRKGSDVTRRNRITWKQKPSRLALFQKLELRKLWRRACFLWIPWEIIFLSHLEPSLFSHFMLWNYKKNSRSHLMLLPIRKDGGKNRSLKLCLISCWGWKKLGPKYSVKHQYLTLEQTKWSYCLLPQDDPETASNLWTVLRGTLLFNCNCTLAKEDQRSVVAVVFDDFLVLLLLRVILTLSCLE